MKIVVVQRYVEDLDRIKKSLDRKDPDRGFKDVVFTTSPKTVLKNVLPDEKLLVFSSFVFDKETIQGPRFAKKIKELNPTAIFILFTVLAEIAFSGREFVDGVISKMEQKAFESVADILASDLENATIESLGRDFPIINFNK